MILFLKQFIALLLSFILSSSAVTTAGTAFEPFTPKAPSRVKLVFSVISDIHAKGEAYRRDELSAALYDMQEAPGRQLDAVVICGDNTDHGEQAQYEELKKVFSRYTPAANKLMVIGNHDTWSKDADGNDDPALVKSLFIRYSKEITGRDVSNVYYSTVINGYHFIVLGSEGTHTYATFSNAQLKWLSGQMAAAARDGKPIFVFSHWPINGTHGLPYTWNQKESDDPELGGIGPESDKVVSILSKYKNVFFISGHIHGGFSDALSEAVTRYNSTEDKDGIHCINLSLFSTPSTRGQMVPGTGYVLEAYDGEVLLRARNFISGQWMPKYDVTYELAR